MSDTPHQVLEAHDVSKSVDGPEGRLQILDRVGLRVAAGESFAIVGASGSGKTTLLGLLAGLDTPSSGTIRLAGHVLDTLGEEARADLRRRLVGFVFQSFHLLPALSAEENVMLPLELEGDAQARIKAREALDAVGLAARRRHYPAQLSGGEQQRVAIARAVANAPRLLLADEPTGNVDPSLAQRLLRLFIELNKSGTSVVIATHDIALMDQFDARRLVLHDGKLHIYD